MNAFAGMALGWLGAGSIVATAVLIEHFRTEREFPSTAGWWLVPAIILGWPWPLSHAAKNKSRQTARIGLVTLVLIAAMGFGWGFGLELYDFLYTKKFESPDAPALNAKIEHLISNPGMEIERTQIGVPPPLFIFR